jgi:DMSO/TMAO reductase YedYZ molybdopterin-dependent catalytic subunit
MSRPEDDPGITPVSQLFSYHIFGMPGDMWRWRGDDSTYVLSVAGLVESPLQLTLAQLRRDFETVTSPMVLQCTTNVHWGRVHFTGARLLDVLAFAGLAAGATKLALRGGEGYGTDLWIRDLQEAPDAFLLAYAMNGDPLPAEHGFPVRLTADGRYGFKWCKWLTDVEVVDYDFKGHYEGKRRWSDAGLRGRPVM